MAKERKLSKAEEAEVLRRKGNRYFGGASDKANRDPSSQGNMMKEAGVKGTKLAGMDAAKRRIGEAGKTGGTREDSGNTREERLHALQAIGVLTDKERAKKRKEK
jgi:hypothetical protein